MNAFEKRYIQCCRSLADHLHRWARDRRDEDKRAISAAQSELCRIHREELVSKANGKLDGEVE